LVRINSGIRCCTKAAKSLEARFDFVNPWVGMRPASTQEFSLPHVASSEVVASWCIVRQVDNIIIATHNIQPNHVLWEVPDYVIGICQRLASSSCLKSLPGACIAPAVAHKPYCHDFMSERFTAAATEATQVRLLPAACWAGKTATKKMSLDDCQSRSAMKTCKQRTTLLPGLASCGSAHSSAATHHPSRTP